MSKIHVETEIGMPDDLEAFIGRCFQTGGNNRLQLGDIFEWLPTTYPIEWYEYLEELEEKYDDTTIWFYRSDYLHD